MYKVKILASLSSQIMGPFDLKGNLLALGDKVNCLSNEIAFEGTIVNIDEDLSRITVRQSLGSSIILSPKNCSLIEIKKPNHNEDIPDSKQPQIPSLSNGCSKNEIKLEGKCLPFELNKWLPHINGDFATMTAEDISKYKIKYDGRSQHSELKEYYFDVMYIGVNQYRLMIIHDPNNYYPLKLNCNIDYILDDVEVRSLKINTKTLTSPLYNNMEFQVALLQTNEGLKYKVRLICPGYGVVKIALTETGKEVPITFYQYFLGSYEEYLGKYLKKWNTLNDVIEIKINY